MAQRKYAALIPLRGGSKSLPKKNIRDFCGKPLCAWVINAAIAADGIAEVWVSTDSTEIAEVVRRVSPQVRVHIRPDELGGDTTTSEAVVAEWINSNNISQDHIVLIQATSPQTSKEDLERALLEFEESNADSVVTGVRVHRFYWSDDGLPLNYNPLKRPMRQDWNGTFMENGAFYISQTRTLSAGGSRLHGKVALFEMDSFCNLELDEPDDWVRLERAFRDRGLT